MADDPEVRRLRLMEEINAMRQWWTPVASINVEDSRTYWYFSKCADELEAHPKRTATYLMEWKSQCTKQVPSPLKARFQIILNTEAHRQVGRKLKLLKGDTPLFLYILTYEKINQSLDLLFTCYDNLGQNNEILIAYQNFVHGFRGKIYGLAFTETKRMADAGLTKEYRKCFNIMKEYCQKEVVHFEYKGEIITPEAFELRLTTGHNRRILSYMRCLYETGAFPDESPERGRLSDMLLRDTLTIISNLTKNIELLECTAEEFKIFSKYLVTVAAHTLLHGYERDYMEHDELQQIVETYLEYIDRKEGQS